MKHPTVRGAGKDRILNVRPDAPDLGDRYFEPALIPLKGWGESEYLDLLLDEDDAVQGIIGASIAYRLAFGPNAGRKALTLQAVPVSDARQKKYQ